MNILFFDTETTGVPSNWKAPVSDVNNFPRLVQIAWIQYNTETGKETEHEYIIRPEGFSIPTEASEVHGITTEKAMSKGFRLSAVLDVFARRMKCAHLMVAHNVAFDRKIVGAELIRNGFKDVLHGKARICTMMSTTKFVGAIHKKGRLAGRPGKWPTLQELHVKLFGHEFEDAHDALADIQATKACFVELLNRDVIQLPEEPELPAMPEPGMFGSIE